MNLKQILFNLALIGISSLTFVKTEEEIEVKAELLIDVDEGVLVLTDQSFDKAIKEHEFVLAEFYAPWCGHCKKLAPEYVKAAKKLEEIGSPAKLAKIDCTVEKALATKYGVKGYPTLKFFKNGKPVDYAGPREAAGIVSWLEKKTGPPAVPVEDLATLNKLKESNSVVVIGVFKDAESDAAKEFVKAAGSIDDIKFLTTSNDEVMKGIQAADGEIVLFKNFDEPRVDYSGEAKAAAIEAWIQDTSVPLIWEFTGTNAQKIFAQKAKTHFLYFITVEDAQKQVAPLKPVAVEYKDKITFVYINVQEKSNEQVMKFFGIDNKMVPMYTLFEMESSAKYMSEKNTVAETEAVSTMVKKYFAKELEKNLKSENIPDGWDKEPVKVLVGKNFNDVALDKSKDVFVEFYAPWCGHCKSLAPIWDKLGEEFEKDDSVVIAKMDATANEADGVNIKSFPTLKFWKRENNMVIDFNGARDFETLAHFVRTGEMTLPEPEEKEEEKDVKDEL